MQVMAWSAIYGFSILLLLLAYTQHQVKSEIDTAWWLELVLFMQQIIRSTHKSLLLVFHADGTVARAESFHRRQDGAMNARVTTCMCASWTLPGSVQDASMKIWHRTSQHHRCGTTRRHGSVDKGITLRPCPCKAGPRILKHYILTYCF